MCPAPLGLLEQGGGQGFVASQHRFFHFFTAVRYLERSEVFAAFNLTFWRARLRPEARRGFFFGFSCHGIYPLIAFVDVASKAGRITSAAVFLRNRASN